MDVLAVKQACKFAKDHAVANGPIVSIVTFCCLLLFGVCTTTTTKPFSPKQVGVG
jgi:uncharacterized membrane protein